MSTVIGHEAVLRRISRGFLGHAVLFSGPSQVGKTTVAKGIAAKILSADSWPGGLEAHPDFWCEDSDLERIGIDLMRENSGEDKKSLKEFFALRPYAGEDRVAVICRAERLTDEAANAVLKLIEEPSVGSHIIICAQSIQVLPETIVSRCQHFVFAPVENQLIGDWLIQQNGIKSNAAETAVALAGGRPGYALQLASNEELVQQIKAQLQQFVDLGGLATHELLERAAALAPQGTAAGRQQAVLQTSIWASFLRDVIRVQSDRSVELAWKSFAQITRRWSDAIPMNRSTEMLDQITGSIDALTNYANPRLCFESLLLQIFARNPAPPAAA